MNKLAVLFLPVLILITPTAAVAKGDWQEGVHYHAIKPVPQVSEGDTVEVTEFFMYTCPHCMEFEPYVEKWLSEKPENVVFTQVPVLFGGASDLHARAYYALELMGEGERMHEPFFEAIHNKRQKLKSSQELKAFLEQHGVDMAKFEEAWNSFAVQTRVNRVKTLMRRYNIRSVPALVVDGRYRSGSGFRGYEDMIEVTRDLVAKVRQERGAVAKVDVPPAGNLAESR